MGRRRVAHAIAIDRRAAEIFAVIDGHAQDARWRKGFVAIAQVTPGPVGVGTEYRETVKIFGRQVEATVRVRERRPGRRLVYDVDAGGTPFVVAYDVMATVGGSRVVRTIDVDFGRLGPVAPLLAALLGRSLAGDLPALKRLLEGSDDARLAA